MCMNKELAIQRLNRSYISVFDKLQVGLNCMNYNNISTTGTVVWEYASLRGFVFLFLVTDVGKTGPRYARDHSFLHVLLVCAIVASSSVAR